MKSYNLQIRVRNNHLLSIMRAQGISTAAELSRLSGVHQTVIGHYLNLTTAAFCSRSERWKPSLVKLADALNAPPTC